MKIYLASDHAGFYLKEKVKTFLEIVPGLCLIGLDQNDLETRLKRVLVGHKRRK